MTGPAFDRVIAELERRGHRVKRHGHYASTRCTHEGADNQDALSIFDNGSRVRFTCFTRGCTSDEVAESLGLAWRDLYDNPVGQDLATYRYDDGRVVHRRADKKFSQSGNKDGHPTLYHASALPAAIAAGRTIYLVEGEEDVHSLEAVGQIATTAPMGARNVTKADLSALAGANVVAVPDTDAEGAAWAELVRQALDGVAASLTFARPAFGKDVSDHLAAGRTIDDLQVDGAARRVTTWARVDLVETIAGLLSGTLTRPVPTVGTIAGGTALFYRGKVNGIAGESGAGKTWTALHVAGEALAEGSSVVYVDHEDDQVGIASRLLDLSIDPDAIVQRFAYHNPSERPTAHDLSDVEALVRDLLPALVIIDSAGEGLALDGANPNADEEVAAWFQRVPRRLARVVDDQASAPAVVVLDHVTKSDDGGGLWPIGSQRKRGAITGVQYMQRTIRPFSKDDAGAAVLVCAKDRGGTYRAGQRVAELTVTPMGGPLQITLDAVEPQAPGTFRPTGYMEKLSRALEGASNPLTRNAVLDLVPGRKDTKAQALTALVAGGYVKVTQAGQRNLHEHLKPYREGCEASGPGSESETPGPGSRVLSADPGTQYLTGSGTQSGPSGTQSLCATCWQPMTDLGDGAATHPGCPQGGEAA